MSVSEKVADLVLSLRREAQLDTRGEALAALAVRLARQVDGCDDKFVAGVAKELRATIDALTAGGAGDGHDDWTAAVSAQVRHSQKS